MHCAIYIRESTPGQAEGFSPDMQERALRRYAQEHGYSLAPQHIYVDYESGRTDRRERFQDLLEAAERHEFDAVLVYHTSRFARNIADSRRIKTHLRRKLGIKVISVTQAYDPDTPWGRLTEGVFELFDENYSDQLSFWISQALRERYQQGELLGRIPIGYTTETAPDGTKRTVPDPHYAPMVQEGFRLYATGEYSYDALAAWSNSRGYVNLKGLPLNRYSWESILTNPAYMATCPTNVERAPGTSWSRATSSLWYPPNSSSACRKCAGRGRKHPTTRPPRDTGSISYRA